MLTIAQIQLLLTDVQFSALRQTLETANFHCGQISDYALQSRTFGQFALQRALYYQLRQQSGLTAQMVVRCIARVADAYKLNDSQKAVFEAHSPITYDDHILSWNYERQVVSIWTVEGRCKRVPYVCIDWTTELLGFRLGETELVLHNGQFYLRAACQVPNPTTKHFEWALDKG